MINFVLTLIGVFKSLEMSSILPFFVCLCWKYTY